MSLYSKELTTPDTDMSTTLKRHWSFLRLLLETESSKQRKALLHTITPGQVKALSEIAHNLVQGTLTIPSQTLKPLRKHRSLVELLGDKKTSYLKKKEAIKRRLSGVISLVKATTPSLTSWIS